MPFDETHPVLLVPKNNVKLWRYMDIASFLSLLVDSSLSFVRADLMEDKFEGTFPKLNSHMLNSQAKTLISEGKLRNEYINLSEILTRDKTHIFMNCWCKEDTEMIHMWKIYSKQNGVAIETTYEDLKSSISDDESIFPTEIRYVDFDRQSFDFKSNGLSLFTIKRIEYKSESEFRLLVSHPRKIENQLTKYKTHEEIAIPRAIAYERTKVIKIKVDLEKLIKTIHISPFAPDWYFDLAKTTLLNFGLKNIPIRGSEL